MSKNVLILMGSPRRRGNTARLAEAFAEGARAAGHAVETVVLADLELGDCRGCGACRRSGGRCVLADDMPQLNDKILAADAVVLATPVYFYSWSGLIKLAIDRTFAIEKDLTDTTFYLLSAGAAPSEGYFAHLEDAFRRYVGCLRADGNSIGGCVFACAADGPRDTEGTPALARARQLGAAIA